MESVRKFALRVRSKQWDASYSNLCGSLNLPTLAKQIKLGVLYRIIHGLAPTSTSDLRNLTPHAMSGFTAKMNSFKHFLIPICCGALNSLPSDVALANYNPFIYSV